jgi:hypothetical protein
MSSRQLLSDVHGHLFQLVITTTSSFVALRCEELKALGESAPRLFGASDHDAHERNSPA